MAEEPLACRFVCSLEWKFEPTITIENLGNRHRVLTADGVVERARRERVVETVLALDMKTKKRWLTEGMRRGWVTSHADVVDQFSPAERPRAGRPYTHTLDFELDTAFHPFKRLKDGRWLRGLELETSLDYLASGLPKKGEVLEDGTLYLDDASGWSFSFVFTVPVAPF